MSYGFFRLCSKLLCLLPCSSYLLFFRKLCSCGIISESKQIVQQWPRVKSISDNMSVAGLVDYSLARGAANEPAIKKVDRVLVCCSLKMGEKAFPTEEYSISKEISAFCTTNLSIVQHQKIVMKAVLKACTHR